MPRSPGVRIALAIALSAILALGAWHFTYPEPDPRSVSYVMWKAGLYTMDPGLAAGTMVGDPRRDRLVVGKTKQQLRRRFGELQTLAEASGYYRDGYNLYWTGKDV